MRSYRRLLFGAASFTLLLLVNEAVPAQNCQSGGNVTRYYSQPSSRSERRVYTARPTYPTRSYTARRTTASRQNELRPTTTVTVAVDDNNFAPDVINVRLGTTVRWVNQGQNIHTITSNDELFDSGDLRPGETYRATFRRAGKYYYYCQHHGRDQMRGVIVVEGEGS